jgi:hypothetical protein
MPGFSILPFVLERANAPRHMLPCGKLGRPIYVTASPKRAKQIHDLTQPRIPSSGLGPMPVVERSLRYAAGASASVQEPRTLEAS